MHGHFLISSQYMKLPIIFNNRNRLFRSQFDCGPFFLSCSRTATTAIVALGILHHSYIFHYYSRIWNILPINISTQYCRCVIITYFRINMTGQYNSVVFLIFRHVRISLEFSFLCDLCYAKVSDYKFVPIFEW